MFEPTASKRMSCIAPLLFNRKQYKGDLRNDWLERIECKSADASRKKKHAGTS
jgi:hypothetical protein